MHERALFYHFFGRHVMTAAAIVVLCLYAAGSALAQEQQAKDGRYYEAQARQAYQKKDYASFLDNMKAAVALRPNHPRLMFNLAAAYSLSNQGGEALKWLARLADMGLVFPAETEDDFAAIKDSAEFKAILKRVERNKAHVGSGATTAFALREKGFIPEGIAYDLATRTFYLSSVYRRKIVSVGPNGEARDFATERDGLWSALGIRVDAARRVLWVTTAAHRQMPNFKEEENGSSGLFKFDLRTGRLIKKYLLPNSPHPHLLGDLAINSRGDVFATDSLTPAIYVVPRARDEIVPLLEGEPFVSPQGLAFTPDEKRLFVADYSKGIFVVDLRTKKVTNLQPAPDLTLLGIDGLYWHKGSLLGVQNGVNPARLVRLFPSADLSRIERLETLEANNPVFDEPTLGVVVGDDFYFVANSQWGAIDERGQLAPPEKLKEHVVLKINLSATRRASLVTHLRVLYTASAFILIPTGAP